MGSYGMVHLEGERRVDIVQTCSTKSSTLQRSQQGQRPAKETSGNQPSDIMQSNLQPRYPIQLCADLSITLDRISDSMYYLWFDPELAHDMVLIRIQRVCREVQRETGRRIMIDLGYVEDGRIVLRVNLALQAKLEHQRMTEAAEALSKPDADAEAEAPPTDAPVAYAGSGMADIDFCRAVHRIVEILATTTDPRERKSFMSDVFDYFER